MRLYFLEHIGKIKKEVLFHEVMREEFDNPKNGANAHKHILQQVLNFRNDTCIMELTVQSQLLMIFQNMGVKVMCFS